MKKIFCPLFISLFLIAGYLSAWGAGRDQVITVTTALSEAEWKVMKEDIWPMFQRRYGIKVAAYTVEATDLGKVLKGMVKAGRVEIDVFCQDNMRLAELVDLGVVEDLSRYRGQIPENVLPALVEAGVFSNKLYFMPYRPNVQIVYYNPLKFEKYKLNPPKNWDELLEVAKRFHAQEGMGRILFKASGGAPTTAQLYEWIASAGGDPFSFNDKGCVATFEFLQELWSYCHPDSKKAKWDTTNEFIAKEVAYIGQNWPFGVPIIVKDWNKKWLKTYGGWEGPEKEVHIIGGEVVGIPKGSPNKRLALKYISFLHSKEVQEILMAKLAWPSIRDDASGKVEGWLVPHFESVTEALKHGIFRKNVSYWSEFDGLLNDAFTRIVIKGEKVKPVLDEYSRKMQETIGKYKKD